VKSGRYLGDLAKLKETTMRTPRKLPIATFMALTLSAMLIVFSGTAAYAQTMRVDLAPGPGAPEASGEAQIGFVGTVMVGKVEAKNLPPQPYGSGRFYGGWFVRNDTGDKAFLGALIDVRQQSIIFSTGGKGEMDFSATHFTTGPNAGSPITLGPSGSNQIIVLIENNINGLTPSPAGPVPGSGVAVAGTF
jgi:hypothetical protein